MVYFILQLSNCALALVEVRTVYKGRNLDAGPDAEHMEGWSSLTDPHSSLSLVPFTVQEPSAETDITRRVLGPPTLIVYQENASQMIPGCFD